MAKFLIIRFSSIGDIVLTTPVIRCLKKQVPDAEIHFLVKDSFRSIVQHNPYIDKVHVLAHSWELMIEELKVEEYDYIIDLHHNTKTLRVKNALKKKSFSFYKLNIQKYFYTAFKINMLPDVHIVDRYLKTVASFGVKNDGAGLDYFIAEQEKIKRQDIPASHTAGYIACVIGAAHGTKRWPIHKWKEFCTKMNHPIILLGGSEDRVNGDEIAAVDTIKVYNACGKFKLNESADLVRNAKLVISNDTGLMHIAAAFKRPVISLWGNTVPAFGMYPYYGDAPVSDVIMQTNKLFCRPCSKIGYNKCPLGHFKCMEKIEVDEVVNKVRLRL
ncbi:MAG: glycosyltransferase family 9 protein [Chitinophagaceae bacterium]|nr:glycosyltransferase family 9 protein [Chitinophagaceae bacterium]MBK8300620.1 glycosyltransferase family 9 protein [Chitinophagaceae bacterium]MBK9465122.1 glycosyltransferase family 9 protein [Chitinophagaceae bacterium]MBK9660917.1 glycosyltransferase family 9 protein [Chitinophagaceae bacterium]MBL0070219.1 glycosyltransferase family 9 protein [Chitinophagaceae bacterium]